MIGGRPSIQAQKAATMNICSAQRITHLINLTTSPTVVAQGVSARLTGHILEALLPQGELKE